MNAAAGLVRFSNEFLAREDPTKATRPPAYKAVGISLAIGSGLFIGTSFVLKKVGLLKANLEYNEEAGEGYGYLKNAYWWAGMTLMIVGEICNFVAYAFVDAILVTPLGALSVVITTILSAVFLKERLSFVGKVGCFICIIGSITIVMNAPAQSSAATIQEMQQYVIAPGFLTYTGVIIVGCVFIIFWAGPRYGKKSMLVYLSICSLIGGLSVVATQGLGAAVVAQASGIPQFNQWFLYVLFVFVVCTLLTEIIYLNKALNLFNAALVTPTYYVYFTSSTIVASAILFRGFKGSPTSIATMVMGFLEICSGVVLLQLSKSAKDVPDAAVLTGDLDQVRTVAEQEQPESEPKADAIRGAAAIIRRISQSRQKMEMEEAKRVYEDRKKDQMEPIAENERVEWEGLRRRKTIISPQGSVERRKTLHPPLGLTKFPDYEEDEDVRPNTVRTNSLGSGFGGRLLDGFKKARAQTTLTVTPPRMTDALALGTRYRSDPGPVGETEFHDTEQSGDGGYSQYPAQDMEMTHVYGLPPGLRPLIDESREFSQISPGTQGFSTHGKPVAWASEVKDHNTAKEPPSSEIPHPARRQFSFQKVFHRSHNRATASSDSHSQVRKNLGSRASSKDHGIYTIKSATEEERLGLVKGDSTPRLPPNETSDEEDSPTSFEKYAEASSTDATVLTAKEAELYEAQRRRWAQQSSTVDPNTAKSFPVTPRTPAPRTPEAVTRQHERSDDDEHGRGEAKDLGPGSDNKNISGSGSFV